MLYFHEPDERPSADGSGRVVSPTPAFMTLE